MPDPQNISQEHTWAQSMERQMESQREALRARGAYLLTDADRYRLVVELRENRGRAGCPIAGALRALDGDSARAQALLETALLAHDARERAQLLRCSPADAPASAHLGLLTLLSPEPAVFRYGMAVAARFPAETQADASSALLAGDGLLVVIRHNILGPRAPG